MTLLEVLIASGVMMLSLSAISLAVVSSINTTADTGRGLEAQSVAFRRLEEFSSLAAVGTLSAGQYDAGYRDPTSGRTINCWVTVETGANADAGVTVNSRSIRADVTFRDSFGTIRRTTHSTLVATGAPGVGVGPDAGL